MQRFAAASQELQSVTEELRELLYSGRVILDSGEVKIVFPTVWNPEHDLRALEHK
jgi:hypothetical protein